MRAIKISLDLPIVPIRKFLIIFFIYIRHLFGKDVSASIEDPIANKMEQSQSDTIQKFKHLLYLKEYKDIFTST